MLEDSVLPSKATYLQHQTNKHKMPSSGSVALPAVMRTGGQGKVSVGQVPKVGPKGQRSVSKIKGQLQVIGSLYHPCSYL